MVVKVLKENVTVLWDKNFVYGDTFAEQIKEFIACSHIFLPIITKSSSNRSWVQQEIGYGMALNIPILPIACGKFPGEMIQGFNAVELTNDKNEWETQLKENLKITLFDTKVSNYKKIAYAKYQCAQFQQDRARLMKEYAENIERLGYYGMVRQKGGLSSFHLPDKDIDEPVWAERFGITEKKNLKPGLYKLLRNERIALQKHANSCGCRLIINPYLTFEVFGVNARIARLKELLEFLDSMSNEKVQIIFNKDMDIEKSVTLVGNWFSATSVSASPGQGFRQTIFTTHAPFLTHEIELFDRDFEKRMKAKGWKANESREEAISALQKIIKKLENEA